MNNSKYIFQKLISLAMILAFSACNVLDQKPEDLIPSSEAIVDAQSANAVLNGLYDNLQNGDLYGGRFILANEMLAKNAQAAGFQAFWQELQSGRVPTTNFHVEDFWVNAYATVNTANTLISSVPGLNDLSQDEKNDILGSAYLIRGLMFFDLLRQFGEFEKSDSPFGIPLKLTPSDGIEEITRNSVGESFLQIETDLKEAINLLADHPDKFYASKGAAQALLARVHLYQKEYEDAELLADLVINNSNYVLSEDYNEVYVNEGSGESVFELKFIQGDDPNVWSIEMYTSPPEVASNAALIEFLENRNEAKRGLLFSEADGALRCNKYGFEREQDGENTIIIRLSEMYLIRAESKAMKAGGNPTDALNDINSVRERAGLSPIAESNISNTEKLMSVLLNERRAEFAFEGHYFFDLIRYDQFESVLGLETFRRRLPIPQREMNITDGTLVQNPGY